MLTGRVHACVLRDDGTSEEDQERREAIEVQGLIAATGIKNKEIKAVFQDADTDSGGFLDTARYPRDIDRGDRCMSQLWCGISRI